MRSEDRSTLRIINHGFKLGGEKNIQEAISNLNKLENKLDYNTMSKPSFKMVVTAVGSYAYQNKEGIWIVPIGTLKD